MTTSILLPTSYLAAVSYYKEIHRCDRVLIEIYEHFPKQTWRNRCSIYSPNGIQQMTIPLDGRKDKTLTKDIRIDNSKPWQKLHWRSLEAAYRSSPYFEYYEDDLRTLFETGSDLLYEFNAKIQEKIFLLLNIEKEVRFTSSYIKDHDDAEDLREALSKKFLSTISVYPRYLQVFENKHGFLSNLSIADLLFNLGPSAKGYLEELQ